MSYDSREDTLKHIDTVRYYLHSVVYELERRTSKHDASKLEEPEKSVYDEFTPLLKDLTYGSDEYHEIVQKMGDGVKHHYKANRHHPEHFDGGVDDMNLIDILEMVCDWKAASKRHTDGDIWSSLEINKNRFGISDQMFKVIKNTIRDLGW